MAETATSEQRFYADGADVRDRQRPGLIAGFGRGGAATGRTGPGTTAPEAAALLNAGAVQPDYYEWWTPRSA